MIARKTVLIVDDETSVREVLRDGLQGAGYEVLEAGSQQTLFDCMESASIDLITLDLNLGSEDGLEIAREIRSKNNVPIVMITARTQPFERVEGLQSGADDYIIKPFHIEEVLVRVDRVMCRYDLDLVRPMNDGPHRLSINHSVLDTRRREYRRLDGDLIDLTETEFRLLELFVANPERVLSRDELMQALTGRDWSPLDRTIDGHIARLRRKIESLSEAPKLIKSVRGVGYVFTGVVREV